MGKLDLQNHLIHDSVVVLQNQESEQVIMAVYVRANESITFSGVPGGTYVVLVSTGGGWLGNARRFSSVVDQFQLLTPIQYQTSAGRYDEWIVQLKATDDGDEIGVISAFNVSEEPPLRSRWLLTTSPRILACL